MKKKPLIVITNDDGVRSPGLLAAVHALYDLGELLVVAPREQQSSSGRAFYWKTGKARQYLIRANGERVRAYGVDASPAVCMRYALQILSDRKPDLVVSGINYGENLGAGLTISGTVGATLEAAVEDVPGLAISLETSKEFHTSHSKRVKFDIAAHFTRMFTKRLLANGLPEEARILNVNVPRDASTTTPWRVTRASRQAYFRSLVRNGKFVGYDVIIDDETLEPDSDIHAVRYDHLVSVTPLHYDLTAHVNLPELGKRLR